MTSPSREKKWTPGPWQAEYEPYGDNENGIEGYEPSGRFYVPKDGDYSYINLCNPKNADLVAAAPELYEALEALCEFPGDAEVLRQRIAKGLAALARASGETDQGAQGGKGEQGNG